MVRFSATVDSCFERLYGFRWRSANAEAAAANADATALVRSVAATAARTASLLSGSITSVPSGRQTSNRKVARTYR